jgi:hypothetical protein
MAYDAATYTVDPLSLTTPRARLEYLRDFLLRLPRKRFDMHAINAADPDDCGSAGCIAGWAMGLFRLERGPLIFSAGPPLGLDMHEAARLFFPDDSGPYSAVTPADAAAVLTHLLNTGKVDWSVARSEP